MKVLKNIGLALVAGIITIVAWYLIALVIITMLANPGTVAIIVGIIVFIISLFDIIGCFLSIVIAR